MILKMQRQSHKQKQREKKKEDHSAKYHTSVVSLNRGGGKHRAVLQNETDRDLLQKLR